MTRYLAVAIFFLTWAQAAQTAAALNSFVLIDATGDKHEIYSFTDVERLNSSSCTLDDAKYISKLTLATQDKEKVKSFLKEIRNTPVPRDEIDACVSSRSFSQKGNDIYIYTVHQTNTEVKVSVKETKRKSRFSEDLSILFKVYDVIRDDGDGDAEGVEPPWEVEITKHTLKESRATVAVSLETKSAGNKKAESSSSFLTGKKEHLFLSADIPVNSVDEVKYDSESKTLVEKDKPSEFHVGVNYLLGDVASESYLNWYDGLFFKAMVLADSKPLDSYGIGVGYRFESMNALSVFAAYVVSKEDGLGENGEVLSNDEENEEFRFGISLNLDKALEWLK